MNRGECCDGARVEQLAQRMGAIGVQRSISR
jgi:hypothetical protein